MTAKKKKSFLSRKNIEFSVQRYFIDALGAMAQGLFVSLIVGLILETIGDRAGFPFLVTLGQAAKAMVGPAIGVAVAYGLKSPPLVLFSSAITGAAGYQYGGPVGAFIGAVIGAEFGKLVSKETPVDIIITPAVTIAAGVLAAQIVGPGVETFMKGLGELIMWATEQQPIPMGMLVALLMGLALTAPISSAALAIMLELGGLAAGAATVGCAAQMIGFAFSSYRENGWGGVLAQGLGTSMLQISNIVRNPWILVPPTLAGLILGPLSTSVFKMTNVFIGAGMGTSGLVGQFGTVAAMGSDTRVIILIIFLHFVLPAVLSLGTSEILRSLGKIKLGDYKLQQ